MFSIHKIKDIIIERKSQNFSFKESYQKDEQTKNPYVYTMLTVQNLMLNSSHTKTVPWKLLVCQFLDHSRTSGLARSSLRMTLSSLASG